MMQRVNDIVITVTVGDRDYRLETYEGEYRNLMMLIYDRLYVDDFGECRGMGRCGTCVVEINAAPEELEIRDRNEDTTLTKMGITDPRQRLSCQILVDDTLHNSSFKIVS
jgi:2Fe-2S ferredoxin